VQRRLVSGARLVGADETGAHVRASFAVFETLVGEHTTLFATGRFLDVVRYEGDALKFVKRTCVLDASLVPSSLPFPI
jgi:3-phenylpropionate/cinnamic acid dioxygenase small subunit